MRFREAVRESEAGTTDAAGPAPPADDSGRPVLAGGSSGGSGFIFKSRPAHWDLPGGYVQNYGETEIERDRQELHGRGRFSRTAWQKAEAQGPQKQQGQQRVAAQYAVSGRPRFLKPPCYGRMVSSRSLAAAYRPRWWSGMPVVKPRRYCRVGVEAVLRGRALTCPECGWE